MLSRDYNHSVRIAAQNVAGGDARIADIDVYCCRFHLHAVLTGTHRIAATVNRVTKLETQRYVAARAIDNRACNPSPVRNFREYVAPYRGILASPIVQDNDRPRR